MYTIKKDSLMSHFLFTYCGISRYNLKWDNPISDVCTLVKKLCSGLWRVFLIILLFVFLSVVFFGWTVPLLAMGWNIAATEDIFRISFAMFSMSLGLSLLFGTIALLYELYYKVKERFHKSHVEPKEPSLFSAWYEGVKNKYCIRVKYEGHEDER